jgi:hypothetical protein
VLGDRVVTACSASTRTCASFRVTALP